MRVVLAGTKPFAPSPREIPTVQLMDAYCVPKRCLYSGDTMKERTISD